MDPGAFIIEVVLVGHSVGVVAHGPVACLMGTIMIKEGLMEPVIPVISPHIANPMGFHLFKAVCHPGQGLIPGCLAKASIFLD